MGRPRKQASQPRNGKKNTTNPTVLRPVTHVQALNLPAPSMEVVDDNSVSTVSYPDIEQMLDDQILSPESGLRDLQQRLQVKSNFNAWLSGLSNGKNICSHFCGGNGPMF